MKTAFNITQITKKIKNNKENSLYSLCLFIIWFIFSNTFPITVNIVTGKRENDKRKGVKRTNL